MSLSTADASSVTLRRKQRPTNGSKSSRAQAVWQASGPRSLVKSSSTSSGRTASPSNDPFASLMRLLILALTLSKAPSPCPKRPKPIWQKKHQNPCVNSPSNKSNGSSIYSSKPSETRHPTPSPLPILNSGLRSANGPAPLSMV